MYNLKIHTLKSNFVIEDYTKVFDLDFENEDQLFSDTIDKFRSLVDDDGYFVYPAVMSNGKESTFLVPYDSILYYEIEFIPHGTEQTE